MSDDDDNDNNGDDGGDELTAIVCTLMKGSHIEGKGERIRPGGREREVCAGGKEKKILGLGGLGF